MRTNFWAIARFCGFASIGLAVTAALAQGLPQGGSFRGEQMPLVTSPEQLAITRQTIAEPFTPRDVQVGDPNASYFNVKVTPDNAYLEWVEVRTDGSDDGIMWHCAIDRDTGNLIPPDCRGFRAYESTGLNRANTGVSSRGVFYAGADRAGHVIVVHPTGPTTGIVNVLSTPPDPTRRAYYPSMDPHSNKEYVAWIKNSSVVGSGVDPRNAWVELQYVDVDDPTHVHVIERQQRPAFGFAPMDSEFYRWFEGKQAIAYGSSAPSGRREMKEYDLSSGAPRENFVTDDGHRKSDPYPWVFGNTEIIMPGIDFQAVTYVYTRPRGSTGMFRAVESITTPSTTQMEKPIFAQSNKPIVWNGLAYTAYRVNDQQSDKTRGSFFGLMSKPGEIWLSTVLQTPQKQWLISGPGRMSRMEPKPIVGRTTAWVFYSAAPEGSDVLHSTWQLRRASTPLGSAPHG